MDLEAFISAPSIDSLTMDYVASKRFTDDKGDPVAWKIKPITAAENEKIVKRNTTKYIDNDGKRATRTDTAAISNELVVRCVVEPNLNDETLQQAFHVIGADDLLDKMLLPGEKADLLKAVLQVNGIENDMADKIKIAKN